MRHSCSTVAIVGGGIASNMGQGACQALEDAAVLLDVLEHTPVGAPHEAFAAFEQRR